MISRAVLMKSGLVSFNIVRQVNTTHPKITMNSARPMTNLSKTAHSTVKRPIHKNTTFKNSNFNQRVNIVKDKNVNTVRPKAVVNAARPKAVVNVVKGNNVNAVKASACWVWKPKTKVLDHDHGVIDSGCSRHMTWNMSYLTDYEEIDGGYVDFGGNPKGRKITGKDYKDRIDVDEYVTFGQETPRRGENITEKARTPQQNRVAERKNRTLIDAARTMLADSKLPTTFWAKAVNNACYVQNRFSKNTPNIEESGPNWLFDIDALTKSMNYKPVVTGNQSNGNACTKACDDAGKDRMETVPGDMYGYLSKQTKSKQKRKKPSTGMKRA
ncbi:putative ribonuclease H-like domain-containing protein [Tanacetum coccineum]